jgi:SAM-dependent methyltransferase
MERARMMVHNQFDTRGSPVNLMHRETTPAAFQADVDYGMQVICGFEMWAVGAGISLKDKVVLEIGPGINLAATIGLRALGASRVYVADRWLPVWQKDYNPRFCRMMAERIRKDRPDLNADIFDRVASEGFNSAVIPIQSQVELLAQHMPEQVDAVFSNAVLEHVADHVAGARSLFAITKDGGINFHQVDFRYHRDFSRPLDHLLMTSDQFERDSIANHYELGCQVRPGELQTILETVGFTFAWHPNAFATDAYLSEIIPLLRASNSAYRYAPEELLKPTGGLFVLRKQ